MSSGDSDTERLGDSKSVSKDRVISEGTDESSESVSAVSAEANCGEHPNEPNEPAQEGEQSQDNETAQSSETAPAGEATTAKPESHGTRPYPWIVSPIIDYLFVAGGLVWLCFLANYALIGTELPFDKSDPKKLVLLAIIFVSQHVFFDAHNIATYFRLWGSQEDRETFRFYRTWLFYAAIALFVLGVVVRPIIGTLVLWYLAVNFWHYAMQTFGIALIYCSKRNYVLNAFEREVFRTLMLVLSAYAIARFFITQGLAPYNLYGAATPFWMPLNSPVAMLAHQCLIGALLVVTAMFAIIVASKLIVDRQMLPLPVVLMLATIGALALLPREYDALLWLYVPGLYHASQYLAVSLSYYVKERGLPEGMDPWLMASEIRKWPVLHHFGKAILIGCTLYIVLPHMVQLVGLGGYDEMIGLTFVVVNYHQFATDAAIWQLRDPRIRKLLIA